MQLPVTADMLDGDINYIISSLNDLHDFVKLSGESLLLSFLEESKDGVLVLKSDQIKKTIEIKPIGDIATKAAELIDKDAMTIEPGAIDSKKLANNSVITDKILNSNVTDAKIADGIQGSKIKGGSLEYKALSEDCLKSIELKVLGKIKAVGSIKIKNGALLENDYFTLKSFKIEGMIEGLLNKKFLYPTISKRKTLLDAGGSITIDGREVFKNYAMVLEANTDFVDMKSIKINISKINWFINRVEEVTVVGSKESTAIYDSFLSLGKEIYIYSTYFPDTIDALKYVTYIGFPNLVLDFNIYREQSNG